MFKLKFSNVFSLAYLCVNYPECHSIGYYRIFFVIDVDSVETIEIRRLSRKRIRIGVLFVSTSEEVAHSCV